jgi:hypothetical protein
MENLLDKRPENKDGDLKPRGLWYADGESWYNWCVYNQFGEPTAAFIYEIKLDRKNILSVGTATALRELVSRYKVHGNDPFYDMMNFIRWSEIVKIYDGIEFMPYPASGKLYQDLPAFYAGLGVPCGCVWSPSAIIGLELFWSPIVEPGEGGENGERRLSRGAEMPLRDERPDSDGSSWNRLRRSR